VCGALLWDWRRAESAFERSIRLNPNYAPARLWNGGFCLAPRGRLEDAGREAGRAVELEPLVPINCAGPIMVALWRRQYDLAQAGARKVVELEPDFGLGLCFLAEVLCEESGYEEAVATMERACRILASGGFWGPGLLLRPKRPAAGSAQSAGRPRDAARALLRATHRAGGRARRAGGDGAGARVAGTGLGRALRRAQLGALRSRSGQPARATPIPGATRQDEPGGLTGPGFLDIRVTPYHRSEHGKTPPPDAEIQNCFQRPETASFQAQKEYAAVCHPDSVVVADLRDEE
jgi:tetratricopeptide (TPR) repeat protein